MLSLRSLLRKDRPLPPKPPADLFDIFHAPTLAAIRDETGRSLGEWSSADAARFETAPRLIVGLLLRYPKLRRRFVHALAERNFADWLLEHGVRLYGIPQPHLTNVACAFSSRPGDAIRQLYLHTPELHVRFPLALLPVGQKRFVKWLMTKGATTHGLSPSEVLWFLYETADDLAHNITQTYLINPGWQASFPSALLPSTQTGFLRWLWRQFPRYRGLRSVRRLCSMPPLSERLGLNILAHFCYPSGLQQAALNLKSAAESVGVLTSCRDVPSGVVTKLDARDPWLGLETFPFTLTCVAPIPHFENCYSRAGLHPRKDVYRIASWYWELAKIAGEWRSLASLIDEIWAPTSFVAGAMRAVMPVPVTEMLPAVSIGEIEQVSRDSLGINENDFLFLFMFDMCSDIERKNPLGLIRAFRRAFSRRDKAVLLIKTTRATADPERWAALKAASREHDILLIDDLGSRARAYGYIQTCDAFVSLHRAEGFGLGLAEAMLVGKPVIATNYSGNLSFMMPETTHLIDYDLIPIQKSGPIYKAGYRWANPSEEHAAELMRRVFRDRDAALAKAAIARKEISSQLSLKAAGNRIKSRLEEIQRERRSGPGLS